jgi:hypothetical protein
VTTRTTISKRPGQVLVRCFSGLEVRSPLLTWPGFKNFRIDWALTHPPPEVVEAPQVWEDKTYIHPSRKRISVSYLRRQVLEVSRLMRPGPYSFSPGSTLMTLTSRRSRGSSNIRGQDDVFYIPERFSASSLRRYDWRFPVC